MLAAAASTVFGALPASRAANLGQLQKANPKKFAEQSATLARLLES
jgi:hypothetical protein